MSSGQLAEPRAYGGAVSPDAWQAAWRTILGSNGGGRQTQDSIS